MLALFLKQCQFSFARFGDTVLGVKRTEILAAATERFGRDGYEDTKWADIAADVGVGPTALYHYFGSKQHCLFMIMDEAAQLALSRFERSVATHTDPVDALQAAVDDAFDVEPADVQRLRVLVAEQGLMSLPRSSKREEEARLSARDRSRSLIPRLGRLHPGSHGFGRYPRRGDSLLLARAVLGLYNSVWQWYRPQGSIPFDDVSDFYRTRMRELIGLPVYELKSGSP